MSILVSADSKRVAGGRLRLKPGKTRCLSSSAHSKRLNSEGGHQNKNASKMLARPVSTPTFSYHLPYVNGNFVSRGREVDTIKALVRLLNRCARDKVPKRTGTLNPR